MVWLEGILHHSDEPPAFLQVPCHVRARLGLARATERRGRAGVRGPNRLLWLAGPADGDRHPPVRTAPERRIRARVRRGVKGGRDDYRIKPPMSTPSISLVDKCPGCGSHQPLSLSQPLSAAASCSSGSTDPRRLISRAGAECARPRLEDNGSVSVPRSLVDWSVSSSLDKPRCRSPFCQRLCSLVLSLDGKLSVCVSVSVLCSLWG